MSTTIMPASNKLASALLLVTTTLAILASAHSLPFEPQQAQDQQGQPQVGAGEALLKPGAVIRFTSVRHGLGEQQARLAFEQKVQLVAGQPIIVGLFEPMTNEAGGASGLVEWHTSDMNDCDEERIRRLLAKFRNPDTLNWTREFKMEFGPEFSMPERVEFEWRNQCLVGYQKRTLDAGPSTNNSTTATTATTTSTTTTTTIASVPPTDQPTTTTPPQAPTTTTEAPMTTPAVLGMSSETPNASLEDLANSTEAPAAAATTESATTTTQFITFSLSDFNLNSSMAPMAPMAPIAIANLVEAPTTSATTSASPTITPEARASSPEPPATNPEVSTLATTETPTTTRESLFASSATLETSSSSGDALEVESEADPPEDLPSSSTIQPQDETNSSPASSSSGASSSPHYGKYIGLTTGFFVFIAYLLCARAYRRQGMYELHEST